MRKENKKQNNCSPPPLSPEKKKKNKFYSICESIKVLMNWCVPHGALTDELMKMYG